MKESSKLPILSSRDLLYAVAPKQQSQSILIAEEDLVYAPSSSLLVSPFFGEPVSDSVHDLFDKGVHLFRGRVLLCSKLEHVGHTTREKNWVYTGMIEYEDVIQIYENIPSGHVSKNIAV